MSCYHPLVLIKYNQQYVNKQGKLSWKQKVINPIEKCKSYEWYEKFQEWFNKQTGYEDIKECIPIPCGQCIGCRLDYSRDWATRGALEALNWKENWFVTLTYDEDHLYKPKEMTNTETGEVYFDDGNWKGCLEPKEVQLFLKRLRKELDKQNIKIRFLCSGEYGDEKERPHYHLIIYNLPLDPKGLHYHCVNKFHQRSYRSDFLESIWGKGMCVVGKVTWSSIAYVARYVVKKQKGKKAEEFYKSKGQIPEFFTMSRRPGIARDYYNKNKEEIYKTDEIIMKTCKDSTGSTRVPKYFDKLLKEEKEELYELIRKQRQSKGIEQEKIRRTKSTLSKKEYLEIKERSKALQLARLKRKGDFENVGKNKH